MGGTPKSHKKEKWRVSKVYDSMNLPSVKTKPGNEPALGYTLLQLALNWRETEECMKGMQQYLW